jgi:hypothetical protein
MPMIQPALSRGPAGADGSQWHVSSTTPETELGVDGDFCVNSSTGDFYQKDSGVWILKGNLTGPQGEQGVPGDPGAASVGTYLVSGANIVWVSGYTYRVGAATYYIAGTLYSSAEQEITLDAADETFDRIDVLALNTDGLLTKLTGTPAEIPAQPVVDYELYLPVTFVFVGVDTVEPGTVSNEEIYLENAEWTATASTGTIVVNSVNNPRTGIYCIEGTNVAAGTYTAFVSAASQDLALFNSLILYIEVKAAWPRQKALQFAWYEGTTLRGNNLTVGNGAYGFNSGLTGDYQQIVIPLTDFGVAPGAEIDRLRITITGGAANVGFYLDDIFLQAGIGGVAPVVQTVVYRGQWSGDVSYNKLNIVYDLGGTYIALESNVNQRPPNTTYWGVLCPRKATRTPHTWSVAGPLEVEAIPGFTVRPAAGQTVSLAGVDFRLQAGTSATFSIRKNGSAMAEFTGLSATTTPDSEFPAGGVALADGDYIDLDITAIDGDPEGLSVTVLVDNTV